MKNSNESLIPNVGSDQIKHEPAVEPSRESKEKKFRIYAKRLFLTYSRTNLSPSEALAQLQTKLKNLEKYVISQEEHIDEPEKGKHLHVYLEFSKKINILSASFLDLEEYLNDSIRKKNVHGEYQAVKNKNHVIAYVKKDGNFITNFETENELKIKLLLIAKEKGLRESMNYLVEKRPELVATHFQRIQKNLKAFLENDIEKIEPRFSNFNYPNELLHWFEFEKEDKTLFLTGPSGTGKTEGVINLLKDFNPFLVTDINGLKDLTPEHKAIIFDDMHWDNIPRETKLRLLEKNRPSNIKIIYQTVKLTPDLVKAVISNNPNDLINLWNTDKAIDRRISHIEISKPIFNQYNQITINIFNKEEKENELERIN